MENLELKVKNELEKLGFNVSDIPRSNKKSADFLIDRDNIKSIVEVKTMNDTEDRYKGYFADLESGEPFQLDSTKDTRKHIHRASLQVESSYGDLQANGFKSICIYSNVVDPLVDLTRRIEDFYGVCKFFSLNPERRVTVIECIGFYTSVFELYQNLDFVMLMSENSFNLLLNDYSANFDKLLESETFGLFEQSENWKIFNPKLLKSAPVSIVLENRQLAVKNPGFITGDDLNDHCSSESVNIAIDELCEKYEFSDLKMLTNKGSSAVIGY